MSKCIYILITLIIFHNNTSCKKDDENIKISYFDTSKLDKQMIPLKGEILFRESEVIGMRKAEIIDSLLIGIHPQLDSTLHIYNIITTERIQALGTKGKGPGEFLGAYDFGINPLKNKLWVLDITLRKLVEYDNFNQNLILSKEYNFQSSTIMAMKFYQENELLLHEFSPDGMLSLYNLKDSTKTYLPYSIPNNPNELPDNIIDFENSSTIDIIPNRDLICRGYRYKDRIDIYNIKTGTINQVKGNNQKPDYVVETNNGYPVFTHTENTRLMYLSIVIVGDKIYGLYDGRNRKEAQATLGKTNLIHVFDLDGNLTKIYKLNFYIFSMGYIPLTNSLFGIGDEGVSEFELDSSKIY